MAPSPGCRGWNRPLINRKLTTAGFPLGEGFHPNTTPFPSPLRPFPPRSPTKPTGLIPQPFFWLGRTKPGFFFLLGAGNFAFRNPLALGEIGKRVWGHKWALKPFGIQKGFEKAFQKGGPFQKRGPFPFGKPKPQKESLGKNPQSPLGFQTPGNWGKPKLVTISCLQIQVG